MLTALMMANCTRGLRGAGGGVRTTAAYTGPASQAGLCAPTHLLSMGLASNRCSLVASSSPRAVTTRCAAVNVVTASQEGPGVRRGGRGAAQRTAGARGRGQRTIREAERRDKVLVDDDQRHGRHHRQAQGSHSASSAPLRCQTGQWSVGGQGRRDAPEAPGHGVRFTQVSAGSPAACARMLAAQAGLERRGGRLCLSLPRWQAPQVSGRRRRHGVHHGEPDGRAARAAATKRGAGQGAAAGVLGGRLPPLGWRPGHAVCWCVPHAAPPTGGGHQARAKQPGVRGQPGEAAVSGLVAP